MSKAFVIVSEILIWLILFATILFFLPVVMVAAFMGALVGGLFEE
jgi:hypothetical protein